MSHLPTLSIVTPVLDRRAMVEEALDSITGIDRTGIEHIVVDGGSTDGTLEFLRADGRVQLIEAPGSGIYEAINIGVAVARGRMIGLLNSDDTYCCDALQDVLRVIATEPGLDMISCRAATFENHVGSPTIAGARDDFILTPRALVRGAVAINARFFSRAFFDRLGGFDTTFRIASDRDFLIRAMLATPLHHLLDKVAYLYRDHAGSRTFAAGRSTRAMITREHLDILRKHLGEVRLPKDWVSEFKTATAIEAARIAVLDPLHGPQAVVEALREDHGFPLRLSAASLGAAGRRLKRLSALRVRGARR